MIILTCQDSRSAVLGYTDKGYVQFTRVLGRVSFALFPGWGKKTTLVLSEKTILNYQLQFSHLLFIGLFKQKI